MRGVDRQRTGPTGGTVIAGSNARSADLRETTVGAFIAMLEPDRDGNYLSERWPG